MPAPFLLYGAYGYTGELIAREAVARGLQPVLAGRDAARLQPLAAELGLPSRAFSLDDPPALGVGLAGVAAVLHCAGPFSRTSRPMANACLAAGVHYLDITGEIEVFEGLAARDAEARAAGVMLLPGIGFDVVPTDCLAAHLARRLPGATRLALAFQTLGRPSRGTATTMIEGLGTGGAVRRAGRIVPVPPAWKTRTIDLGHGPVEAMTIPWGDVSTAFHSTGIPDVEVYLAAAPRLIRAARRSRWFLPLLRTRAAQALLKRKLRSRAPGPDAAQRERTGSLLWGEVADDAGRRAVSRLETPNGYALTALSAVEIAARVVAGGARPGFQTPSRLLGPDFVLELEGVTRVDVE